MAAMVRVCALISPALGLGVRWPARAGRYGAFSESLGWPRQRATKRTQCAPRTSSHTPTARGLTGGNSIRQPRPAGELWLMKKA
jgi:hypothetical protein